MRNFLLTIFVFFAGIVIATSYAQYEYEETSPVYQQEDIEINFDDEMITGDQHYKDINVKGLPQNTMEPEVSEDDLNMM